MKIFSHGKKLTPYNSGKKIVAVVYIKVNRIRVRLGLARMSPGEKLARANAVYSGLKDNPAFPDPPVDLDAFKAAIDSFAGALVETLDGSRTATARKNHQEETLDRMLHRLARYVEFKADGDMERLLSSGFPPLSNERKQPAPVSESIRTIERGPNSGEFLVRLMAVPDAYHHELRWAVIEASGIPETWTSQPIINTRPATLIAGLSPGATYIFEARALLASGHTEWRGRITRICT